jgi:hypothetical protein
MIYPEKKFDTRGCPSVYESGVLRHICRAEYKYFG